MFFLTRLFFRRLLASNFRIHEKRALTRWGPPIITFVLSGHGHQKNRVKTLKTDNQRVRHLIMSGPSDLLMVATFLVSE